MGRPSGCGGNDLFNLAINFAWDDIFSDSINLVHLDE